MEKEEKLKKKAKNKQKGVYKYFPEGGYHELGELLTYLLYYDEKTDKF